MYRGEAGRRATVSTFTEMRIMAVVILHQLTLLFDDKSLPDDSFGQET